MDMLLLWPMVWGGLPHGEIASKIACTTIISHIQATYKDFHSEFKILKEALEEADSKIYSKGLRKYKCQMGTTIAAAIVTEYMIFYTWQGNVRIYHKHNGELKQLTTQIVTKFLFLIQMAII